MGAIYDVIIDLRPRSPTYLEWIAVELSADNHKMIYVPKGFAHGYQTLADSTEVFYHVSEFYEPAAERGVCHDDSVFEITWPMEVGLISSKDRSWPGYKP
jgi:dTDP-4-dehydrorhamnose 3,5-epimerase